MSAINLGSHTVKNIPYNELKPGDLICDYQPVSAHPFVMRTVGMQSWLIANPDFRRLTHFSIVLEAKVNRMGVYTIAHATGRNSKVTQEQLDLKRMPPGQTVVVFRSENLELNQTIAELANKLANDSINWALPFYPEQGLLQKIMRGGKALTRARKFIAPDMDKILKKIARFAVDSSDQDDPKFLKKDGDTKMNLSCSQFVLYTIVASQVHIRERKILDSEEMTREEKIDAIFAKINQYEHTLEQYVSKTIAPCTLAEALIDSPSWGNPIGYAGSYSEVGKVIRSERDYYKVSEDDLKYLFVGVNPNITRQILSYLEIINENGQVVPISFEKTHKVIAAFVTLCMEANYRKDAADLASLIINRKTLTTLESIPGEYTLFKSLVRRCNQSQILCGGFDTTFTDSLFIKIFEKYATSKTESIYSSMHSFVSTLFNSESHYLNPKLLDKSKILPAFLDYQSLKLKLSKETIEGALTERGVKLYKDLCEKSYGAFSETLKCFSLIQNNSASNADLPRLEELSEPKKEYILRLEAFCLKRGIESNQAHNELSRNWLEIQQIQTLAQIDSASQMIKISGIAAGSVLTVTAAELIFSSHKAGKLEIVAASISVVFGTVCLAAMKFRESAVVKAKNLDSWSGRIKSLDTRFNPNVTFPFKMEVEYGSRPWLRYTEDEGASWFVEPLTLKHGTTDEWMTNLRFEKSFDYEYFIAPYDVNLDDPYQMATQISLGRPLSIKDYDIPLTNDGKLVCPAEVNLTQVSSLKFLQTSIDVGYGGCPWIYFSDDNQNSFKLARMELINSQKNLWSVRVSLSGENITYQIIITDFEQVEPPKISEVDLTKFNSSQIDGESKTLRLEPNKKVGSN